MLILLCVTYKLKSFKSNVTDMRFFTNIYCRYIFFCCCSLTSLGVGKGSGDNFKLEMSQVGFSAYQSRNKVWLYMSVYFHQCFQINFSPGGLH